MTANKRKDDRHQEPAREEGRFRYQKLCEPSHPEGSFRPSNTRIQIESLTAYPISLPHDCPYPFFSNDGTTIIISPNLILRIHPDGDPHLILASTELEAITVRSHEIRALVEALANAAGLLAVRAARQED